MRGRCGVLRAREEVWLALEAMGETAEEQRSPRVCEVVSPVPRFHAAQEVVDFLAERAMQDDPSGLSGRNSAEIVCVGR